MIVLIGARAGSKRIPDKALQEVGGESLIARAVRIAREAGGKAAWVFSDSEDILREAAESGAHTFIRSPSAADERDWEWIVPWLPAASAERPLILRDGEPFVVLRCTSPFLKPFTLREAFEWYRTLGHRFADSVRAVRRVSEHPMKMWEATGYRDRSAGGGNFPVFAMRPLIPASEKKKLYEYPTQSLMDVYVQAGAFEITTPENIREGSLSGSRVAGWLLEGDEGLDINTPEDLERARSLARGR